jgi:hypothetical protein
VYGGVARIDLLGGNVLMWVDFFFLAFVQLVRNRDFGCGGEREKERAVSR